jgi:hypothetical protein
MSYLIDVDNPSYNNGSSYTNGTSYRNCEEVSDAASCSCDSQLYCKCHVRTVSDGSKVIFDNDLLSYKTIYDNLKEITQEDFTPFIPENGTEMDLYKDFESLRDLINALNDERNQIIGSVSYKYPYSSYTYSMVIYRCLGHSDFSIKYNQDLAMLNNKITKSYLCDTVFYMRCIEHGYMYNDYGVANSCYSKLYGLYYNYVFDNIKAILGYFKEFNSYTYYELSSGSYSSEYITKTVNLNVKLEDLSYLYFFSYNNWIDLELDS